MTLLKIVGVFIASCLGLMNGFYWGVKLSENRKPTVKECFYGVIATIKYAINLYRK